MLEASISVGLELASNLKFLAAASVEAAGDSIGEDEARKMPVY